MNIDYAICQALGYNTDGLTEALVEYDVSCQWSINFAKRLEHSTTLHLPQGLSWIAAVGKFHLGTHEQDCFAKFSLNFVHGAGQQDGEILETLWAPLNKIAGSVRAMTKASRQEMVDAQMRDSNWKKLTNIGAVLLHSAQISLLMSHSVKSTTKKYGKACKEEQLSRDVFNELDSLIDPATRMAWTKQEELAITHRGKYLRIYQVDVKKGTIICQMLQCKNSTCYNIRC